VRTSKLGRQLSDDDSALEHQPCVPYHRWGPYNLGDVSSDSDRCECGMKTLGEMKAMAAERSSPAWHFRAALRGSE
jgi:hypothetical protein